MLKNPKKLILICAIIFGFSSFTPAFANIDGEFDTSYGSSGRVSYSLPGEANPAESVLLSDGNVLHLIGFSPLSGSGCGSVYTKVFKTDMRGNAIESFGTNGWLDLNYGQYSGFWSILEDSSGSIFIGGRVVPDIVERVTVDGTSCTYSDGYAAVIKVNANGVLDPNFGIDGLQRLPTALNFESVSSIASANAQTIAAVGGNQSVVYLYKDSGEVNSSIGDAGVTSTSPIFVNPYRIVGYGNHLVTVGGKVNENIENCFCGDDYWESRFAIASISANGLLEEGLRGESNYTYSFGLYGTKEMLSGLPAVDDSGIYIVGTIVTDPTIFPNGDVTLFKILPETGIVANYGGLVGAQFHSLGVTPVMHGVSETTLDEFGRLYVMTRTEDYVNRIFRFTRQGALDTTFSVTGNLEYETNDGSQITYTGSNRFLIATGVGNSSAETSLTFRTLTVTDGPPAPPTAAEIAQELKARQELELRRATAELQNILADNVAPTITQLNAVGIYGASERNYSELKESIALLPDESRTVLSEIRALVTTFATVDKLADRARVTQFDLAASGLVSLDSTSKTSILLALRKLPSSAVDSLAEVKREIARIQENLDLRKARISALKARLSVRALK